MSSWILGPSKFNNEAKSPRKDVDLQPLISQAQGLFLMFKRIDNFSSDNIISP